MTLHGTDLIAIAAMIAAGFALCYVLLLRKLRAIAVDREMKVADQIGSLDEAIRALETRLAEHPMQTVVVNQSEGVQVEGAAEAHESGEIDPEIQAAIAAAAVAAVGPNAVVHSVKSATSPWTQQGRVLVQGGDEFSRHAGRSVRFGESACLETVARFGKKLRAFTRQLPERRHPQRERPAHPGVGGEQIHLHQVEGDHRPALRACSASVSV